MDLARIEGGDIVVRVSLDTLEIAMRAAPFVFQADPDEIDGGFRVTDSRKFGEEIVRALNDEQEDGTTPIHLLFDSAAEAAMENGAEGIVWPAVDMR